MTAIKPKKGQILPLHIDSLAFGGLGIARHEGHVIFVRNGLPGQTVEANIIKRKRKYLEAKVLSVTENSPDYVPERCRHFKYCGGCTFQNLDYRQQLVQKQDQVIDIMTRLGQFEKPLVMPILGCSQIFHYRNKMEYTFSNHRFITELDEELPRDFVLGAHTPGRYDKILNIDECHLQIQECSDILRTIKSVAYQENIEPYDIVNHTGFLRYLVIRNSFSTGEIMVNLVTSREEPKKLEPLTGILIQKFSSITSLVNNINSRKGGISQGEKELVLSGKQTISESIDKYQFEISANSFFQTNPVQAEKLYDLIKQECHLTRQETIFDLYCGTGTIGIYLAESAKEIIGIEMVPSAVKDARENARFNGVKNIRFFEGDLMDFFQSEQNTGAIPKPDIIILDPPRSGLHPRTVTDVIKLNPRRIIYVSCNPSTQARDLKLLCSEDYMLKKCLPVDMFPHTPHIENVAVLLHKDEIFKESTL